MTIPNAFPDYFWTLYSQGRSSSPRPLNPNFHFHTCKTSKEFCGRQHFTRTTTIFMKLILTSVFVGCFFSLKYRNERWFILNKPRKLQSLKVTEHLHLTSDSFKFQVINSPKNLCSEIKPCNQMVVKLQLQLMTRQIKSWKLWLIWCIQNPTYSTYMTWN